MINAPSGIFNSPFNASWNASGINAAFLPIFPDLADDSYATIGLEGPAATSGIASAADPSLVEDAALTPTISGFFTTPGSTTLDVNTLTGGSWYVLNTAGNALPDADNRWLIAQITTAGSISGQINYQVFPLGVGADEVQISMAFDGAGTYGGGSDIVCGCMEQTACNYNSDATNDDGSCTYAAANFDCDGNCLVAVDCAGSVEVPPLQMSVEFAEDQELPKELVTVTAMFLTSAAFAAEQELRTVHATAMAIL